MKKILKIMFIVIIAALVIVGASVIFVRAGIETPINPIGESITNGVVNGIIDATDIKGKAEEALKSNVGNISTATGIPADNINDMIDDLGIQDWTVVTLPNDAVVSDTGKFVYGGEVIAVTSYTDPSIVTLGYKGTNITFELPDSAQGYVKYLDFLF